MGQHLFDQRCGVALDQGWYFFFLLFYSMGMTNTDGMIDLDSGSTGTNIDSGKRLKSSKGSGVEIGSGSGSKSRR